MARSDARRRDAAPRTIPAARSRRIHRLRPRRWRVPSSSRPRRTRTARRPSPTPPRSPFPRRGRPTRPVPQAPYPSTMTVSGMAGTVSAVQVVFNNLTHGALNDVDAMLVAPTGAEPRGALRHRRSEHAGIRDGRDAHVRRRGRRRGAHRERPDGHLPSDEHRRGRGLSRSRAGTLRADDPGRRVHRHQPERHLAAVHRRRRHAETSGQMAGGWSLVITTQVAAAATTTALTTSGSPSTTGSPVTFTASVTAGGSPVTAGTVSFTADGVTARHRRPGRVGRRRR